jgi:two-component system sensor histidine kinase UhpB
VTTGGRLLYASPPSTYKAGRDAPAWFTHWMEPGIPAIHMQAGSLTLQPAARRRRGRSWICGTTSALPPDAPCWPSPGCSCRQLVCLHHALKPLENVMAALDRTGQGNFDTRLPTDGPAELARLGHAFNGMASASTRPLPRTSA